MLQRGVETNPKNLEKAQRVFNKCPYDVAPWNGMINYVVSLHTLSLFTRCHIK
jgi:hypothetical protein